MASKAVCFKLLVTFKKFHESNLATLAKTSVRALLSKFPCFGILLCYRQIYLLVSNSTYTYSSKWCHTHGVWGHKSLKNICTELATNEIKPDLPPGFDGGAAGGVLRVSKWPLI